MKKNEEIIAYKVFFKGLKNNLDGINYEIGKEYQTTSDLQYMKSGFHMCKNPEDCFRFIRPVETDVDLALVRGFGKTYGFDAGYKSYDDTLGYIYITEKMEILKVLTREEILDLAIKMSPISLKTFLDLYPITPEESDYLKDNYIYQDVSNVFGNSIRTASDLIDRYQKTCQKKGKSK